MGALKGSEAGGHLIIITRRPTPLTDLQQQNILTAVNDHGVRISSVVLADPAEESSQVETVVLADFTTQKKRICL